MQLPHGREQFKLRERRGTKMDKAQGNTQTDMNAEKLEQYFLEITEKDIAWLFPGVLIPACF